MRWGYERKAENDEPESHRASHRTSIGFHGTQAFLAV
jgi:hypothetical protein